MDNKEAPKIVGICTEMITEDWQECGGAIIQKSVEIGRGRLARLLFGNRKLVWKCSRCGEETPLTDPSDIFRSSGR